eukprot:Nitzschia sp. Nitz4//scaffold8_size234185//219683//220159//NITZ4_001304-RA/size234185-processed-gene-0.410-mRNA-1//-1//CDS//3329559947//757//frame0
MGLLKGIDPLLTPDLLHILASMGHGDQLVICDCNFPAAQVASQTTTGKCVELTVGVPEALSAICSLFPLDLFESVPAVCMEPSPGVVFPQEAKELYSEMEAVIKKSYPDTMIGTVERMSFYEEAKKCFAVVHTMERRPYGNIIVKKGAIGPDGIDLRP